MPEAVTVAVAVSRFPRTDFFPACGFIEFAATCRNGHEAWWRQRYDEKVTPTCFTVDCEECR